MFESLNALADSPVQMDIESPHDLGGRRLILKRKWDEIPGDETMRIHNMDCARALNRLADALIATWRASNDISPGTISGGGAMSLDSLFFQFCFPERNGSRTTEDGDTDPAVSRGSRSQTTGGGRRGGAEHRGSAHTWFTDALLEAGEKQMGLALFVKGLEVLETNVKEPGSAAASPDERLFADMLRKSNKIFDELTPLQLSEISNSSFVMYFLYQCVIEVSRFSGAAEQQKSFDVALDASTFALMLLEVLMRDLDIETQQNRECLVLIHGMLRNSIVSLKASALSSAP